jgi:hypothetical protein
MLWCILLILYLFLRSDRKYVFLRWFWERRRNCLRSTCDKVTIIMYDRVSKKKVPFYLKSTQYFNPRLFLSSCISALQQNLATAVSHFLNCLLVWNIWTFKVLFQAVKNCGNQTWVIAALPQALFCDLIELLYNSFGHIK